MKLQAFTLTEVLVAMVLSGIVCGMAFTGMGMAQRKISNGEQRGAIYLDSVMADYLRIRNVVEYDSLNAKGWHPYSAAEKMTLEQWESNLK